MTFSVEPGIYFAGAWGARIEDIVLVTADGGESLNNRPRDLHVIRSRKSSLEIAAPKPS
jgi:Xaa-Pro aminopeptidase